MKAIEINHKEVMLAHLIVRRRDHYWVCEEQLNLDSVWRYILAVPAERVVPRTLRICDESVDREVQEFVRLAVNHDI